MGCSFTADCGFHEGNMFKYHWPFLLKSHYNFDIKNSAIGGMSNDEIFFKTMEESTHTTHDLIIVMWSCIGRKWIYYSKDNIDDFTIINSGVVKGLNLSPDQTQLYAKIHYSYFDNHYVLLKQWLLQVIALQNTFKKTNQKYIFIKGFENYLSDFLKIQYSDDGFNGMTDDIKQMLDFDNRPDYYIKEKIDIIKKLINKIDISNWVNFKSIAFNDMTIDFSDDGEHPGQKTNSSMTNAIMTHIDKIKML